MCSSDLKKIEEMSLPYPLIQEKVDQAEEDPQVIFDAVQKIIFDLSKRVAGKIKAISWSSQMHSLIGLGKDEQALTNSITWADNRSSQLVAQAKENGVAQDIYQQTGMPPHPMAPVYKLLSCFLFGAKLNHESHKGRTQTYAERRKIGS